MYLGWIGPDLFKHPAQAHDIGLQHLDPGRVVGRDGGRRGFGVLETHADLIALTPTDMRRYPAARLGKLQAKRVGQDDRPGRRRR